MRPNLWLLPANINLVGAESELVSVVGRETVLREALQTSRDKFDYCLIDCAPSLGLLTLNALAAAEDVLIPLQPHFLALRGFGKLLQTVELVNKRINPNLKVKWVLLCMFDGRASLPNEVKEDIEQFLENAQETNCPWSEAKILPIHIRRNIKLAEAPSYGKTIFEYEQNCHGAEDYKKVAELIHAEFYPSETIETSQPATVNEMQEQSPDTSAISPESESQEQQQPDIQPIESQTVAIDEIQEQSPVAPAPFEQPESQLEQLPEPQPAEPQATETNENQNQPPIEIKSISPDQQQQQESDVDEQSSEFTQTTSDQSDT
jgi:chromosome partitioning protein